MNSQSYNYILDLLTEKGWTEKRKIDITEIIKNSLDVYIINDAQKKFLQNFAGIEIFFRSMIKNSGYLVQFIPEEYNVSDYYFSSYEKYAQTSLMLIGGIDGYDVSLMLSSDLKIYGIFEDEIAFYGNDVFEFLINLYEDREIKWHIVK